jgi:hypothetical protein
MFRAVEFQYIKLIGNFPLRRDSKITVTLLTYLVSVFQDNREQKSKLK